MGLSYSVLYITQIQFFVHSIVLLCPSNSIYCSFKTVISEISKMFLDQIVTDLIELDDGVLKRDIKKN